MGEPRTQFEPNPHGTNELIEAEEFFISYNSRPASGFFSSDTGGAETALHIKAANGERGVYLILNGDHRVEYAEAAARGLKACVAVYESHRATQRSSWSEDMGSEDALEWFARRLANAAKLATASPDRTTTP